MKTASERRAALVRLVESKSVTRVMPPLLLPATPFFELAGEEFGRQLFLTQGNNGLEYCLRPDFTLPIAKTYLGDGLLGTPASYTYFGPIFRQGESGPEESDQAGLELLGQPDPEQALEQVLTFARWGLGIFGIGAPAIRLGAPGLFEAFLDAADVPPVWRARVRHRFGHPEAMDRLMQRLLNPTDLPRQEPKERAALIECITGDMLAAGLPLVGGRLPEEIADRYIEKQELADATLPQHTVRLIADYLAISDSALPALNRIGDLARANQLDLKQPLQAVRALAAGLSALSPDSGLIFDASFSPRLDYYTGMVFEMTGINGTVLASGGQYDRLLERLGAGRPVAAAGCALWVDRLESEARE